MADLIDIPKPRYSALFVVLGSPQWNGRSPRFARPRSSGIRKAGISVGRVEEQQNRPLHRWYVSSNKTLVGACR